MIGHEAIMVGLVVFPVNLLPQRKTSFNKFDSSSGGKRVVLSMCRCTLYLPNIVIAL